jgi:polyphenol oxidase
MIDITRVSALDGMLHGFVGRTGGVSAGDLLSLNTGLGSGDDPAAIAENRQRALNAVAPGATLIGVFQVHSPDVVVADAAWTDDARPQADAIVTDRPGLALGILTADCAPILFADHRAGVIGAAHAGWKGALNGVTDATIAAMEQRGARRDQVVAAIGPCITRASYEVDDGFRAQFCSQDVANDRFFTDGQRAGHPHFDLEAYVAHRLAAAGIGHIEALGLDTYADPARYFSFRRATHKQEATYGRQISIIALP